MVASARYLELLVEMRTLHEAKGAGYSGADNPDTFANFREAENWGVTPLLGVLCRLGDKYKRAQNLVRDPKNDQVGEALTDTLMDLSAYALIAICFLEEGLDVTSESIIVPNLPRCDHTRVRSYGEFQCHRSTHSGDEHDFGTVARRFCGATGARGTFCAKKMLHEGGHKFKSLTYFDLL